MVSRLPYCFLKRQPSSLALANDSRVTAYRELPLIWSMRRAPQMSQWKIMVPCRLLTLMTVHTPAPIASQASSTVKISPIDQSRSVTPAHRGGTIESSEAALAVWRSSPPCAMPRRAVCVILERPGHTTAGQRSLICRTTCPKQAVAIRSR
jgi:hypothetical protein